MQPDAADVWARLDQLQAPLQKLRQDLHRQPRLAGQEHDTAGHVAAWLKEAAPPGQLLEGLGGAGMVATYGTGGPTVLLRAELDALPLEDPLDLPHHSRRPGVAHKCGHDGHCAILCGVACLLRAAPAPGRVLLLFQPAEETGAGARAVLGDPRFSQLAPDWAFALHNVPGRPRGQIACRPGPFAAASEGLVIRLLGISSHASEPHLGRSPAGALATLLQTLPGLGSELFGMETRCLVTPTSAGMGEGGFGISPGQAELSLTLRASTDEALSTLTEAVRRKAERVAQAWSLQVQFSRHDPFPATVNSPGGVELLHRSAARLDWTATEVETAFPWSEDFGEFLRQIPGAFFALGAGPDCAPLHSPTYDFPDQLIGPGAAILFTLAHTAMGSARELD